MKIVIGISVSIMTATLAHGTEGSFVRGTIKSEQKCNDQPTVLWVSQSKNLLYQVELPINGEFEFNLLPGSYNFSVTTKNGCFAEKAIQVIKGKEMNLSLMVQEIKGSPQKQGAN